jgi:serine phosphatase RsbU (regulator of sigma subunit)
MQPQGDLEDGRGLDEIGRVNRLYAVLSKVNEAIVRVHEPRELYEAACRIAVEDGRFILAWIGFVDPETRSVRWVAKYGRDDGYLDTVNVSLNEDVPEGRGPTGVALREGRPFINNDTENNPIMRPWRDEQLKRGYRSSASFPLKTEGKTTGVITLYAGEPHYFDEEEVRLLECLADDFSFALESADVARQRAQAVEALRRSRDELEVRVKERTATLQSLFEERTRQASYAEALNRINGSVHSTLDVDEIMNRVVVEIAEALDVDAAVVQVRKGDHWEFEYQHGLPPELRGVQLLDADVPLSMEVLETRRPLVVNNVALDSRINAATMEKFRIASLMAVPLIMRGQVFGVLLADRFGEPESFTDEQLDFLQKAAATLALALENARLYETERTIADRLQEALLSLPDEVAGIEFAHAYHSATEATRVGGDFYDLFELSHDHIGVLIGDVAGKGLDAAVLTSSVKNTIRAHANERGKAPAQILELTNELLYRSTPPDSFVTVFFGILDCRDGRFVYANGGHTTAALVRPDGTVVKLPVTGPLLGALDDAAFEQSAVGVDLDELLFLYTDGVTEARRDADQYGEERLFAFLSSVKGAPPREVIDAVLGDILAFSQTRLRDGLAVLAVKRAEHAANAPRQQKLV